METEVVILEIMSVLEEPPQAPGMPDRLTELEPQISSLPHCRRWWWRQSLRRLTHDQWKGIHFSFFLQRGILNWIQMFFDAEAKRPQYPAFCFPGGYWLLLAMKPKLEPLNELKLWSVGAEEQGHGTAGVMAFQELSKMERRALCSFQLQEPEQGERAAVSQPEILDQPYQLVEGEAFCTSPGPLIRLTLLAPYVERKCSGAATFQDFLGGRKVGREKVHRYKYQNGHLYLRGL
nr:uncharacterized protein LOC105861721 isoform X4 [Microcebus murinus]